MKNDRTRNTRNTRNNTNRKIVIGVPAALMILGITIFIGLNADALVARLRFNAGHMNRQVTTQTQQFSNDTSTTSINAPINYKENTLYIERIGVEAAIIWPENQDEDNMQVALRQGPTHDPRTALPDEQGNILITGHSSGSPLIARNAKTIFANLEKLQSDDEIALSYGGDIYHYKVDHQRIVDAADLSVLEQTKNPQLTLMTCWPLGTSWKRLIVVAPLESLENIESISRAP